MLIGCHDGGDMKPLLIKLFNVYIFINGILFEM